MSSDNQFVRILNFEHLITGIIKIKPGAKDHQTPHPRDEVYLLISGNGFLQIKDKSLTLEKNKLYFVPKDTLHYFYGNTEEIVVVYFFGGGPHFPITYDL
jgi:mannose-6-phosphate isomerase-like protein (cupin superfamily)